MATRSGMPWTRFTAPDVGSALELARSLQADGTYQYFRGQESSTWLPMPSYMRLSDETQREAAYERVDGMLAYIRAATRAHGVEYTDDDIIAIAQHYGLPTTFLDLTTDPAVAACFACPPGSAQTASPACILLYAHGAIERWCKAVRRSTGHDGVELLRIDVANLWRLQSQSGLFLHIQVPNLCDFFMPDMIEFPHPAGGFTDPQCVLYPDEKSELEVQLDLLFDLEHNEGAKAALLELIPNRITPTSVDLEVPDTTIRINVAVDRLSEPWVSDEKALHERLRSNALPMENRPLRTLPKNYFPPAWEYRTGLLWPHPSWFGEHAQRWLRTSVQRWADARALDAQDAPVDLGLFDPLHLAGGTGVRQGSPFEPACGDRQRSRRFLPFHREWRERHGTGADGAATELEDRFGTVAGILWDGIRSKPLPDELAAACMTRFFTHARRQLDLHLEDRGHDFDEWLGQRDRDHIKVEYAAIGGHSQTCGVPCSELAAAVRDDLDEVVAPADEFTRLSAHYGFAHLTQMLYPQYLFDFDRFVRLYCLSILPYQAFIGAITWRDHLGLAFNVRQIKIFGMG